MKGGRTKRMKTEAEKGRVGLGGNRDIELPYLPEDPFVEMNPDDKMIDADLHGWPFKRL